jgi:tetratricopeptide (TPR) repeat protein
MCNTFIALVLHGQTTSNGWNYETLRPGGGPQLTRQHAMLNHNQLVDQNGRALVSTYAIDVPDYQVLGDLSEALQTAFEVMRQGGKYRFTIPVESFKAAARNPSLNLPGEHVFWEIEVLQVLPPKPDVGKLIVQEYQRNGAAAAFDKFQDLRAQRGVEAYFSEWKINQLGYYFLQRGHVSEAIEIFLYNIQAYPRSANAHDSLGEAYLAAGNRNMAMQHYRQSLEYNPRNANAREKLSQLEK